MTAALEGRGWVSSMPRLYFTPGKDLVPILQKTGWALRLVEMGGKYITTALLSIILLYRLFSKLSYSDLVIGDSNENVIVSVAC